MTAAQVNAKNNYFAIYQYMYSDSTALSTTSATPTSTGQTPPNLAVMTNTATYNNNSNYLSVEIPCKISLSTGIITLGAAAMGSDLKIKASISQTLSSLELTLPMDDSITLLAQKTHIITRAILEKNFDVIFISSSVGGLAVGTLTYPPRSLQCPTNTVPSNIGAIIDALIVDVTPNALTVLVRCLSYGNVKVDNNTFTSLTWTGYTPSVVGQLVAYKPAGIVNGARYGISRTTTLSATSPIVIESGSSAPNKFAFSANTSIADVTTYLAAL